MSLPLPGVVVDLARGLVRVRCGSAVLEDPARRSSLLGRLFVCPHVHRVDIGRAAQVVEVRLDVTGPAASAALASLGRTIRETRRVALPCDAIDHVPVSVRRLGGRITTWAVAIVDAGRLRFSHPRLPSDRVFARRVERLVLSVPGVIDLRSGGWRGGFVVRFDGARLDPGHLLERLQAEADRRAEEPASSPWNMAGRTATVGVAATAELAVTALAPVSAVLLVGTNIRTLGAAAAELRRGRVGMATVASAIVLGTLVTGQFVASSLMAWSFDFWRRRHRRDIEAERRLLLEDAVQAMQDCPAGCARDGGQEGPLPVERQVAAGEVVPLDGRIVAGGGVIDDRAVSGVSGGRLVIAGDMVPAGAVLLGGALAIAPQRSLAASRLALVGRMLEEATSWRPGRMAVTSRGEEFGEKFAVPTLATAGLGLLAGDVGTAVAVMRPDYASAEAISGSLEDLDAVARGLVAGCVVRAPHKLDALAATDTLLILDHPEVRRCRLQVSRVVSGAAAGGELRAEAQGEAIRWAASLAAHIADERREALAELAASRGSALLDVVPDEFGDHRGLRISFRQGDREIVVHEADPPSHDDVRPLVLAISGRPLATFEFATTPERRATRGIDRLRACGLNVLFVSDEGVAGGELATELHCDGCMSPAEGSLSEQVAALVAQGRRIACVADGEPPPELRAHAGVSIHLGDPAEAATADIVVLSADLGRIADLHEAARERCSSQGWTRRLTILPNVACIAGAFLLGFTSIMAVVISNLATFRTYRVASQKLVADRRRWWLRARPLTRRRLPS